MRCLGIETSCDETAVAVVHGTRLLGQKLASQADLHALFGGVVPEIASREHLRLIHPLTQALFKETGLTAADIDVVAVSRGPGLLGSLLVGLGYAKGFSLAAGKPLVGVDHCLAHLLAASLETDLEFPALGLLVSGGHTQIYILRSPVDFEILGRTLDDAAGEAFDKVAKLVNLPYPGGQYIDRLAMSAEPDPKLFPKPYLDNQNLDFSFSGLKTAVATRVAANPHLRLDRMSGTSQIEANAELAVMLASFNLAVAETLRIKLQRALNSVGKVRSVIVAGGVAANTLVRQFMTEMALANGVNLRMPSPWLCTDNAAMVASAGLQIYCRGFVHDQRLEAVPRGKAVPRDYIQLSRSLCESGPMI
ncbi:tRNA (adenosine(37)-N6)-threonylcarbamoyltransferase complex transferase subunit TsaD [Desulfocurvibacter africanus]|uniref:tRNA (adenosine(37)-N6)-threonylcarbamoyltransferase complex transferase subunit TsaD n=1 Tax=Desulfocurvibacter africanus TaxID=873 RepID=UPI0003FAF1DD|nr:tRNA (adenosine(37)-N6)-threonylcarbamoyltransferase complex transferase subunit TsaD [Desulfocurvibacter africanus]